jgi:hypothetical protein
MGGITIDNNFDKTALSLQAGNTARTKFSIKTLSGALISSGNYEGLNTTILNYIRTLFLNIKYNESPIGY